MAEVRSRIIHERAFVVVPHAPMTTPDRSTMKPRVCFLGSTRYSRPLDQTSEKKFRLLSALGQLFVVSFNQHPRPCMLREHAIFYLMPDIPLPVVRYVEMFTVAPCLTLWLILRHNIQILVAQSPYEGFAAALATKVAKLFGRRILLVIESHGDFEESIFLQRWILFPQIYRFLMRHVASFALKHADILRAVSNSTRIQLEQWAPHKPIVQFHTWTDIEIFMSCRRDEHEPLTEEILYSGVLIPRKGIHHLINAFAHIAQEFPQSRLVLVGAAENRTYAASLQQQSRHLGLESRVDFVGSVSQLELAAQMHRSRVFVLPTYSEGLPRVVLEAMAVGIPVIASAVSGIPEIVQDGREGFLVEPGNEEALSARIRWLLQHPDGTRKMGQQAQNIAKESFSSALYVEGYRQIFQLARDRMR
jgi:glycosyltransferase involved in cell wall biosynthesis